MMSSLIDSIQTHLQISRPTLVGVELGCDAFSMQVQVGSHPVVPLSDLPFCDEGKDLPYRHSQHEPRAVLLECLLWPKGPN